MLRRLILGLVVVLAVLALAGAGLAHWFLRGDGVRAALEQQAAAYLGQPVRIARADVDVLPRPRIELGDVVIGEPAAVTLATVRVSTGLRGLLSRRVEDAEVAIATSQIDLPLPLAIPDRAQPAAGNPAAPTATAPAGGAETAAASAPVTIASIRAIRLDDIRVRSRGREIVVSAEAALDGSTLTLSRFVARSGATELDATGTVVLAPSIDAKLTVNAERLALDELLALANAFSPPADASPRRDSQAAQTPTRLQATVRAGAVDVGEARFTQFAAEVTSADGRLTINPVVFELFGGRFSGRLGADISQPTAVGLTADAGLENLDVAALAAFGGADGAITGRLSGKGTFNGRGATAADAVSAMRGTGQTQIVDGTITRLDLVRTVILFFGRPSAGAPPSAGSRFESIDATFSLANQIVQASALSLQSQDADIIGEGSLALATKALDARARLVLSESLSAQAGSDLARFTREGNRIVLPATIGGTLDKPQIRIDAGQAIQRGLKNEIQRRLDRFLRGPSGQ